MAERARKQGFTEKPSRWRAAWVCAVALLAGCAISRARTEGADGGERDTPSDDAPACAGDRCDAGADDRCSVYCGRLMVNCAGEHAQFDGNAVCLSYCRSSGWPAGEVGAAVGNTLECRIEHAGRARSAPAEHCAAAGPSGDGVCGAPLTFRSEPASMYASVDRMGLPAIATVLVPDAARTGYNDATPRDDADLTFAGAELVTLSAIHMGLDDDLTAIGLTPCSMTETRDLPIGPGGISLPAPLCVAQSLPRGSSVAEALWPDTLRINPAAISGFPNGRQLADPVIDITLAVILLDIESPSGCGGSGCTPATLVGTNPPANDVAFSTTFPYLAPAHTL